MSDKHPPTDKRPLVELKNDKLIFRQKPLSLEKSSETMQEIVQFREMLETRITQNAPPLETIPEAYNPLIAKLVHESDKTLQTLAKHIQSQLLPSDIDEDDEDSGGRHVSEQLPPCCVESAITHVAIRINYGAESMPNQAKVPAHLCIWRWEVDEQNFHWLPKTVRDRLRNRLYERRQVKDEVAVLLDTLPEPDNTTTPSSVTSHTNKGMCPMVTDQPERLEVYPARAVSPGSGKLNNATNKKPLKSKGKLQPKGAKLEKQLKARESWTRSQNLMANFLAKSKAGLSTLSTEHKEATESTDFDRVFKPFALRKGVEMAPINYFGTHQRLLDDVEENPITILDDRTPLPPPPALVIRSPPISLPVLDELAEAEAAGDISVTRSLLNLLEDRTAIPAKVFIFHEDTRPGYLGTWTRVSSAIRSCRPFARDVVAIDYSYDSSEEWEEENPGDADDVADDNDDDDEGDIGEDSDADSWLVDDGDDVEAVAPMDEVDAPPLPKRRLEGASGAGNSYKKRRVVPLVPFVKGPIWDPAVTKTVEEVFKPFRVRFFNDNACPIDPFTYISPLETTTQAVADRPFLVPAIPEHVQSASSEPQASAPGVVRKPPLGPKHPFPEAHIPILVAKINELATGSIVLIVEALYQELKDHKVKKNSIEAKVKELAVKKGRVWVTKQDGYSDG
ncbi:hypothetical protein BDM02DRAFT_3188474 [Thelephora ganbajun]|uniref:Uncharacterized protein n=1 Tax=Thelephora ganbajun TaxID=370292 RepID=A0ACB6ZB79_THEGA|nr:hypothetical protein BDM02DRAFT_3188474 [Thelephora ganbajun]